MRTEERSGNRQSEAILRHDMLGIGFGPANLALAIALQEQSIPPGSQAPSRFAFLERKNEFGWHRDMLLDDATMQVSFLKDLATLRNPQSRFTFINFLHEQGRLQDFINFKSFYPLRIEFHEYLSWAARLFEHLVHYRENVVSIEPQIDQGTVHGFLVRNDRGSARSARHVVCAPGLRPSLPEHVSLGQRIWHSSQLLSRLATLQASTDSNVGRLSFAVVGGGQSAAEVIALLHRRFDNANIHSIHSRFGFAPSDSSPFINQIFDQEAIRLYHRCPVDVRARIMRDHRNTNYSVVDEELILQLYRLAYRDRLKNAERMRFHPLSRVKSADEGDNQVHIEIHNAASQERYPLGVDIAIFATGYRSVGADELLGPAKELCVYDRSGNPLIDEHYKLQLKVPGSATLFVQGATEHSHGIGSTLLSNVAHRAQVIADQLLKLSI